MTDSVTPDASLLVAAMLAVTGGFLDGFSYFGHEHVFANAMTGNVVLLGGAVAMRDWAQALRHITPIAAFVLGVAAAQIARLSSLRVRNLAAAALLAEGGVLFAAGWLPKTFPSFPLILGISFVAAFQSSIFTTVETWSYNSTMTTANLRNFAAAAVRRALHGSDSASIRRRSVFGVLVLSFAIGASLGGACVSHMANKSLWLAAVPLLIALALLRRKN